MNRVEYRRVAYHRNDPMAKLTPLRILPRRRIGIGQRDHERHIRRLRANASQRNFGLILHVLDLERVA